MGSLLVAGAVKGLGEGIQENVVDSREVKAADAEHARDLQLQKMRMAHETKSLSTRIDADDKRAGRQNEWDVLAATTKATTDATAAEAASTASMAETKYRSDTSYDVALLGAFQESVRRGLVKGNGWDSKIEMTDESIDLITGERIPAAEVVWAVGPDGRTWRQNGDKMFDAGDNTVTPIREFESEQQEQQAIDDLMSGSVKAEHFKSTWGFLPASYIFGEIGKGDGAVSDMVSFMESGRSLRAGQGTPRTEGHTGAISEGAAAEAEAEAETSVQPEDITNLEPDAKATPTPEAKAAPIRDVPLDSPARANAKGPSTAPNVPHDLTAYEADGIAGSIIAGMTKGVKGAYGALAKAADATTGL